MNRKRKKITNQMSLKSLGNPWETKGIFSEHYLNNRLPESQYWPSDEEIFSVFSRVKEIFDRKSGWLGKANEEQTKTELIDDILQLLGYDYIPQNVSPGETKTIPDYLLFAGESQKAKAYEHEPKHRYKFAISLLEAKKYHHPLGKVSKQETPGRFPHNQVRDYLQDAYDESKNEPFFNWAILTNGGQWRLYTRNASTSSYFEFDLEESFSNFNSFKYFYILFRKSAFIVDESNYCFLDRIRNDALKHQAQLESNLRERIYSLLEILAKGFFHQKQNGITEDDIEKLYEISLIFLYRLLFILYAEGRDLLPVKESGSGANALYRNRFSLARLKYTLQNNSEEDEDVFTRLYNEIDELFTLIDGSDEDLNRKCRIAQYNGGLFDTSRYPELRKWKVGDYTLKEVLRGLIFVPQPARSGSTLSVDYKETIDYADLEVRQLGSIYEGLLEHHLEIENGGLRLVSDKRERRASGSYYTPDYIVKYIIEETLDPVIAEVGEWRKVKNSITKGIHDNSFTEAILDLKVLDPAMGSGHFLVRATEYLAEEIASHPTTELAVKSVPPGESHDLAEIAYWQRRVVESCIYGVDINPLAVELAKLSLWLTCISSTQPLNFLDHHLRCGNSLIGNSIDELNRLPTKDGFTAPLFEITGVKEEVGLAIKSVLGIIAKSSDNLEEVKEKGALYQKEVQTRLAPFRTIANVRTAFDLGINIDEGSYSDISLDLMQHKSVDLSSKVLDSNNDIWDSVCAKTVIATPFHWELEFPEVYRARDIGGFDVVIGNPPYVRQESLGELKNYFVKRYESYAGTADLYVYFIEKGLRLLKPGGRFGMIVSNKWMRARYGEKLRRFVRQFQIERLVDFGELKVFEGSSTFPLVIIVDKRESLTKTKYAPIKRLVNTESELESTVAACEFELENGALEPNGFALISKDITDIIKKMKAEGTPLGQYVNNKIYYGIKTGFNKAFVIDNQTRERLIAEDPKSEKIIKPFLIGDDVRKYHFNYRDRHIILTKIGVQIENYPAIYRHLEQYQEQLKKRWDKGKHWWELRACSYYKEFEKSKILWPDIAKESRFAWDDKGYYCGNTCYIIPVSDFYLLGVLNSKLIWKYLVRVCSVIGDPDKGGRIRQINSYMQHLPIKKLNNDNSLEMASGKKIRKLVKSVLTLYKDLHEALGSIHKDRIQSRIDEAEQEIDRLVYELYGLTEVEIGIVESSV